MITLSVLFSIAFLISFQKMRKVNFLPSKAPFGYAFIYVVGASFLILGVLASIVEFIKLSIKYLP